MHLTASRSIANPDLERAVVEVLNRRLLAASSRPVAVALSGGGDSLGLLLIAAIWARAQRRNLRVLTVDHGLRPDSAAWTKACAASAERLGLCFEGLAWAGDKPATGLPAAARAARHVLLANAARAAGARVILMGHTADDVFEARLMRQAGSTTPDPREWAPAPVWPQGRRLFLLRPMIGVRRHDIRAWLAARGETWIDDPTNDDSAYARPRARRELASGAVTKAPDAARSTSAKDLVLATGGDTHGGLEIERDLLREAAPQALTRFLSAVCLCAAGTGRPPRRDKVERLAGRVSGEGAFTTTLAGARIVAELDRVCFRREAGEAARGGLQPLTLDAGETGVWDGRFEITAPRPIEIHALKGTALPAAIDQNGDAVVLETRALAYDRLLAACGAIEREPA